MSVPNWISYEILFTNRRIAASHSPRRRSPKFQKENEKHSSIRLKVFLPVFFFILTFTSPTFILPNTHTHTHSLSAIHRICERTKHTIQLSAMLLQCFVNNGVAINRATDVNCFARYAGKCVRRNFILEPAWRPPPVCCQSASQNRVYKFYKSFFFSFFGSRETLLRVIRAKWVIPKWPLSQREQRLCSRSRE